MRDLLRSTGDSCAAVLTYLSPSSELWWQSHIGGNQRPHQKPNPFFPRLPLRNLLLSLFTTVAALQNTDTLSKQLQSKMADMAAAMESADDIVSVLENARCNAEQGFRAIYSWIRDSVLPLGLEITLPRQCLRQNTDQILSSLPLKITTVRQSSCHSWIQFLHNWICDSHTKPNL